MWQFIFRSVSTIVIQTKFNCFSEHSTFSVTTQYGYKDLITKINVTILGMIRCIPGSTLYTLYRWPRVSRWFGHCSERINASKTSVGLGLGARARPSLSGPRQSCASNPQPVTSLHHNGINSTHSSKITEPGTSKIPDMGG